MVVRSGSRLESQSSPNLHEYMFDVKNVKAARVRADHTIPSHLLHLPPFVLHICHDEVDICVGLFLCLWMLVANQVCLIKNNFTK